MIRLLRAEGMAVRRAACALTAFLCLAAPDRAGAEPCPTATLDSAKALAERAAVYLAVSGPEVALPRFMDRDGGFVAGDLYVFVFDLEGRLRASGGWPETVGARVDIEDGDASGAGDGIYARMRRVALEAGTGWVEYSWYNPCTHRLEPKASYVVRVGGFIVGVGAYKKPGV